MNKKTLSILILILSLFLFSCEKDPTPGPVIEGPCWTCQQTDIATSILYVNGNPTYYIDTIAREPYEICGYTNNEIYSYQDSLSFAIDGLITTVECNR